MKISGRTKLLITGSAILAIVLIWLITTDSTAVWPIRNTLQYHLLTWWWGQVGYPEEHAPGVLRGTVRNRRGEPIAQAWVLVSRWDGTTYAARSGADGSFIIEGVPAGSYLPVAGAPGYESVQLGGWWEHIKIEAGAETIIDPILPEETLRQVRPGRNLRLTEPAEVSCTKPLEARALRQEVTFDSAGAANQLTLYYRPITTTASAESPVLLTVYPGPADSWECVSVPLAAAGFAVLAVGPAYSFELENDIDELERLIDFTRAGMFPNSDGTKIALVGGSYSSLHVQRLLQRDPNVRAAVLLGPPTDLFDMRRRLENGTFIPPFGLDRALIALGFPSDEPLRYWRYSGAYQVQPDYPPILVVHSRGDKVVPYQQSDFLVENLAAAGVVYETHFFDGASHYLIDTNSAELYQITLDFLARYVR
jgi:pimeloyl-ACP methyl ester carboxylesterase